MTERASKPLGRKAYGSIGHLPNSRTGPGDWHIHEGQARIACERARDRHDRVIVTEKLDGSCTAVAKVGGRIIALGRAGWLAETSPHEMHHVFAAWVRDNEYRFIPALDEGERMVGEWLAQAHGTLYELPGDPWVPFDVMAGEKRLLHDEARERFERADLVGSTVISDGPPLAVEDAMSLLGEYGRHGATEPVEGAVWRVERREKFDYLTKWVRPDKVDGKYLPEISGGDPIWLWQRIPEPSR